MVITIILPLIIIPPLHNRTILALHIAEGITLRTTHLITIISSTTIPMTTTTAHTTTITIAEAHTAQIKNFKGTTLTLKINTL